jgi:tetratricopeptide (TPR) repeat protein
MKSTLNKLKIKPIGWWASVATIVGLIIALVAWLLPNPIKTETIPIAESTSIAQSLQISDPIPQRKPGTVRILVATFDEVSQPNYKVTDLILANLRAALNEYPDTEVLATDRVVIEKDGSETAIKIGEAYDASIVIWGWYGLTENAVPLGVHFEIIQASETFHPNTCGVVTATAVSQIRKIDPIKLSDLTLQTDLSNELSYVTIFTLGLARYDAEDWQNAVFMFDDAISHLSDETILSAKTEGQGILLDQNLLYYYRGKAQERLGNYPAALGDLQKLPNPDLTVFLDIASAFAGQGDVEHAIEIYSSVIQQRQSYFTSLAAFRRGMLYEKLGKLALANSDFSLTIQENQESVPEFISTSESRGKEIELLTKDIALNPENPFYYYWRGIKYQNLNQDDKALEDFNKAIKLVPEFYVAREARSHIYVNEDNYQAAFDDLNYIFRLNNFRTPCNLQNRGLSYRRLNHPKEAKQDFLEVVSLTTKTIEENPNNAFAYYVRSLAYNALGTQSILQKLSPFQFNFIYSLRDMLKVRELDSELAFNRGEADNKAIATGVFLVIGPYLFLGSIFYLGISSKKDVLALYRKIEKKVKRSRHAHRP